MLRYDPFLTGRTDFSVLVRRMWMFTRRASVLTPCDMTRNVTALKNNHACRMLRTRFSIWCMLLQKLQTCIREARSSNFFRDTTYADFDVWFPIVSPDRRHLKTSHGRFLLTNAYAFTIHENQLTPFDVIA
jgi:hypothetical protein